jgi:hypothetical protein
MHRQPVWIEAFVVRHCGVGAVRMRAMAKQQADIGRVTAKSARSNSMLCM